MAGRRRTSWLGGIGSFACGCACAAMVLPIVSPTTASTPTPAGLQSCVVIVPVDTGDAIRVSTSPRACETRLAPASTFKIAHALVALETDVVTETTVLPWDGTRHPEQPAWDRDQTVISAIRPSAVWVFQAIAPRIGAARAHAWLEKLEYGNADTSGPIGFYWLNGRLRISPDEQVRFRRRFYGGTLPVSASHVAAVRAALAQEPGTVQNARGIHRLDVAWREGIGLNAKTGATTTAEGEGVSWLVGQLTVDARQYVFASAAWQAGARVDALEGTRTAMRAFVARGVLQESPSASRR